MIELIRALQVLSVCAWAVPLWVHRVSLWHVLCRRPDRFDTMRAGVWVVASGCASFSVRWLVFPGGLVTIDAAAFPWWASSYIWSIFGSQLLTWTAWEAARHAR